MKPGIHWHPRFTAALIVAALASLAMYAATASAVLGLVRCWP